MGGTGEVAGEDGGNGELSQMHENKMKEKWWKMGEKWQKWQKKGTFWDTFPILLTPISILFPAAQLLS